MLPQDQMPLQYHARDVKASKELVLALTQY